MFLNVWRLIIAALLGGTCVVPVLQCQPAFSGTEVGFRLRVVDSYGEPTPYWFIDSFRDGSGREFKTAFDSAGNARIPTGIYRLRIESEIFLTFEASVNVSEPGATFIAGLLFAGIDNVPPFDDLKGRFTARPPEGAWCKLSGLFVPDNYFALVLSDGSFVFRSVHVGKYVLICGTQKQILTLRAVEVRVGRTPDIVVDEEGSSSVKPKRD